MIIGRRNNILQKIPIKLACQGYYLRWWYNGWHYWFFLPGDHSILTEGERYRTISTRKILLSTGQITLAEAIAIRTILHTREVYLWTNSGWANIRIEPGTLNVYNNMVNGEELEFVAIIGSKEVSYDSGFSPVVQLQEVASTIEYCEVVIGTQVWMCYNWDAAYPGSKVYGDDESNRALFGGLYSWAQVMSPGFVPEGWHVPTREEWQTLKDYLGGDAVAGGHLKSLGLTYWDTPNTDADDSVGFDARGSGYAYKDTFTGAIVYANKLKYTYFWTADEASSLNAYANLLRYNDALAYELPTNKLLNYLSVRLIKNADTVLRDRDGNSYTTVIIGRQEWIVQNFRCTKYADGAAIPNITDSGDWQADVLGAYCWYDNDEGYKDPYGAYYNFFAVDKGLAYFTKGGIQQPGWQTASRADYLELIETIGGNANGGKLKETGLSHWNSPNAEATNEFGFTLVAGGNRNAVDGVFQWLKKVAILLSSSISGTTVYHLAISWDNGIVAVTDGVNGDNLGCNVRMVRYLSGTPPTDPTCTVLGGTGYNGKIIISSDEGETFSLDSNSGESYIYRFFKMANGEILYSAFTVTTKIINYNTNTVGLPGGTSYYHAFAQNINDGNIYGTGDNVNITKSTDNGVTWADDIAHNVTIGYDIAIIDNDIIVVGSGGISVNGVVVQAGWFRCIYNDSGILYAGSQTGHIWKSIDNGATWADILIITSVAIIRIIKNNGRFIVLSQYTTSSIYYSDDDFDTFNLSYHIISQNATDMIAVSDNILLVSSGNISSKIHRSTDNGLNWSEIAGSPQQGENYVFSLIKI